ncbi:extracellular solute-binding protein [Parablautia muri]|uniref:Extracellular solute-binding protein n=1 Tax=Parablautia muri TaxID=2320879 RepID=A0A9X5GR79_9FIRM|nr:extracellular solute-binding protein [Parablautia muri]NBJ91780.1 extracellular solute-binding protein [Parablautia muri]
MKLKKLLGLILTGAMVLSMVGCGSSGGGSSAGSGNATEQETENEQEAEDTQQNEDEKSPGESVADSGEEINLTFWHIWPDAEMGAIVESYVELFEDEHPNVHIESVATQEVEYQNNKLKVAAATGAQGDVFMCWGGGYAKAYVDAGVVLPLDDLMEKYGTKDELLDGTLTYGTYDGKTYGLPLKQWAGALFCNEELFEEYNVKIPETFDELLEAVKTFRAAGVTPMVLGAKEGWHIGMIQNALAVRTEGADYMNRALQGEETLDTEGIVKSAELLCELNEAGAFPDGTLGLGSEESQEEFYMGLIPMYFGGSWVSSGCDSEENEIQGLIKAVPMPAVEGGKGGINSFSGGAIDMMMINANTANPDVAYEFAVGITKYMSEEAYKIGDSLPAWKVDVDESEVSPTLRQVEELIKNADGYVLAWDTFLEGAAIEAHYELLQGLIAGTTSPEEFAAGMQAAQEEVKGSEAE